MNNETYVAHDVDGGPHSAEHLLALIAHGDRDAMPMLHAQLHGKVHGVALRVLRDRMFAEDVTQEVFVWLWSNAAAFDPARGSASAWIATIARRRAIDLVRREVAWRNHSQHDVSSSDDTFGEQLDQWARREHLRDSMVTLTDKQRAAITTAYLSDHTYSQSADLLELKMSTFKSRLHEGLVALRTAFLATPET